VKCEEILPDAAQLRKHMRRAHSGGAPEKSFMCAECGQMFTRLGHLRRHARLHSGDKPFMCNRCACQFARADHLRRHLQAHHADDPTLRSKDAALLTDIKSELDPVPLISTPDDLSAVGIPGESDNGMVLSLPVFPGPSPEKLDTARSQKPDQGVVDPVPASSDHLSGYPMPQAGGNGAVEAGTATESVPVFPGRVGEGTTGAGSSQSSYQTVDISSEFQTARVNSGSKSVTSKDRSHSATLYEAAAIAASRPVFPGHGEDKSRSHYPAVEIPSELDPGRKSATAEDRNRTSATSIFQESVSSVPAAVSPPEHRNFLVSGDSATFRADFWHRTSPAYMNDRLFLAGAANLRHFDVDLSRTSEPAHRYSQSHSMMPGNFLGGVVDFRRLPPENPAVTSPQLETTIPDASPLSLARYQRK